MMKRMYWGWGVLAVLGVMCLPADALACNKGQSGSGAMAGRGMMRPMPGGGQGQQLARARPPGMNGGQGMGGMRGMQGGGPGLANRGGSGMQPGAQFSGRRNLGPGVQGQRPAAPNENRTAPAPQKRDKVA